MYADIKASEKNFVTGKYDERFIYKGPSKGDIFFEWNSGILTDWILHKDGSLTSRELGYVHFQKRCMKDKVSETIKFCIVPNAYIDTPNKIDFHLFANIQNIADTCIRNILSYDIKT